MSDQCQKFPDQEELERELSEFLSKKYGRPVRVISPLMVAQPKGAESKKSPSDSVRKIQFDMKPEELEAYLDQYVVKQDQAKAILATKICTHYHRIKWRMERGDRHAQSIGRIKNNIILMGPTGVGKTYLVKLIAQKIGVPFVKGDATKFSETGYVGGDVEDLVRDLVRAADDDVELAQYGIIYIDEIDKIASSSHLIGPDVSRTGVQRALLKPMEETDVDLRVPHDPVSQLQAIEQYRRTGKRDKQTINTKNILFIVSGAFNGLADIVKKRIQQQGVGFKAAVHSRTDDHKFLQYVKAEDLMQYGFESEFVGRLPVIAVLEPLEVEDLYHILKNPNSPVIQAKKEDFRCYGIDLKFQDEALWTLAQMAYEEKTGARGLVRVIERVLMGFEKRLPSTSIRHLVVTKELVLHPHETLEALLKDPESPQQRELYDRMVREEKDAVRQQVLRKKKHYVHNYPFVFTPGRLELLVEQHVKTGEPIEGLFDVLITLYNQIKVFEEEFHEQHGFKIHFDDHAITGIMFKALAEDKTATAVCRDISRDYDYAFRLVAERSGQIQFILPKGAVDTPEAYLDELIRDTYRKHPLSSEAVPPQKGSPA
ncbi:MAG: AAA family ATPase [Desulfosoma sp.]|uniref:AAA family ATPase n=1 Tax=Desulfosoma sp. TaxID=2603217 RepID=UPI004049DF2B